MEQTKIDKKLFKLSEFLDYYVDKFIKQRGFEYFQQGRVREVNIENNVVHANVIGTISYFVELEFDKDLFPLSLICTCPYNEKGICRHIVAVLYKLNYEGFFTNEYYHNSIKNFFEKLDYESFPKVDSLELISNKLSSKYKSEEYLKYISKKRLILEKEVEEKKEESKFYELAESIKNYFENKKEIISKKERPIYILRLYGYETEFKVSKKTIKKYGNIGQISDFSIPNYFSLNDDISNEEKLIIQSLKSSSSLNKIDFYDYKNGIRTITNNLSISKMFSDILEFLSDKEVYVELKYHEPIKVEVLKEKANASILIEQMDDKYVLRLKIQLSNCTFNADQGIIPVLPFPVWIYYKNYVLQIANLQPETFFLFQENNWEIDIPLKYKEYFEENVLTRIANNLLIESNIYQSKFIDVQPIKRIYLEENEGNLIIRLSFLYDEYEVPYNSRMKIFTLIKDNILISIKRDNEFEESARKEIKSLYVKEIEDGIFIPRKNPIDFLFQNIPHLKELNYEIFGEADLKNLKVNVSSPRISILVSSGIDWFDLEGNVQFGDASISIIELISLLKQKKNYVQLSDGSVGLLPEKWINRLKRFLSFAEIKDNKIKLSSIHTTAISEFLETADQTNTDDLFNEKLKQLSTFTSIQEKELPKNFIGKLRDYQKFGFNWFYFLQENNFGGILADDMGLGKTVQVLTLLLNEKQKEIKEPNLIVVPTSVVFNWINEANKFTPSLKILNHTGQERDKETNSHFNGYDIVLTSYPILLRDIEQFSKTIFHYIILDESQKIKNPLSETAKATRRLKGRYKLCLTGTPIENNLYELWSQFSFLNPGMLGSLNSFRENFLKPIQKYNDEETTKFLRRMIYPFILRRTKDIVAKELPPKEEIIQYCEMTPEQEQFYNSYREKIKNEIIEEIKEKGINKSGIKIIEGLLRLRQICNHPYLVNKTFKNKSGKFEEFKEKIVEIIDENHKVLIFSQFVQMLELIRKFLNRVKIKYEYLTGSTKDRETVVNNFQSNEDIKVFLISLKAGGFGLNLTAADYVFHYDPWWNPAVEMQATDRTHRIGQVKNIFVYKFITKNTVEDKILLLQEKKRKLVENIITNETGILKNITKEDIEILFG